MNIKFKNYESIYFKGNAGLYSISQTGLWLREKNEEFEKEYSFLDHIEILRWHLIRSAIAIFIVTVLVFIFPLCLGLQLLI